MSLPNIDHNLEAWLTLAANCLTALGTVGAVIAALYFSRRDRRPRLAVSGAIVRAFAGDAVMVRYIDGKPLVRLTATNVGFVPIRVLAPCWRVGIFRREVFYQQVPAGAAFAEDLTSHGQQRIVEYSATEVFPDGWHYLREAIRRRRFQRLALRSVKCGFATTTGRQFFGPINWELKKMIAQDFEAEIGRARPLIPSQTAIRPKQATKLS